MEFSVIAVCSHDNYILNTPQLVFSFIISFEVAVLPKALLSMFSILFSVFMKLFWQERGGILFVICKTVHMLS